VYLPDARELLDVIASVNKINKALSLNYRAIAALKHSLDYATNTVWKRIVLVRPAYILRNIAEEQDTCFRHRACIVF
jgi:hypothetical protein